MNILIELAIRIMLRMCCYIVCKGLNYYEIAKKKGKKNANNFMSGSTVE